MKIVNMNELDDRQIRQTAAMLSEELPLGWATINDAMEEITERLIPENTLLAAIEDGDVIGWGGILPAYNGKVYELHPLVVRHDRQKQGVGGQLIGALEDAARKRGGLTMYLGADDEKPGGETSLANADLYEDLPGRIRTFDPGTHQTAFYLKMGYQIVGVIPDANGIGRPDIFMAKRL